RRLRRRPARPLQHDRPRAGRRRAAGAEEGESMIALAFAFALPMPQATPATPAAAPTNDARLKTDSIVLNAAEVDVGDGTVFKPGTVVILDGKIVAVGGTPPIPSGSHVVDLGGLVLTAGLVDAASQLGTQSLSGYSEQSSEVAPQYDAADAIDYYSKDFDEL